MVRLEEVWRHMGQRGKGWSRYTLRYSTFWKLLEWLHFAVRTNNIVGVLTLLNGDKFDGMFQSNKMHGPGKLAWEHEHALT